jgi:hypothetical protein
MTACHPSEYEKRSTLSELFQGYKSRKQLCDNGLRLEMPCPSFQGTANATDVREHIQTGGSD